MQIFYRLPAAILFLSIAFNINAQGTVIPTCGPFPVTLTISNQGLSSPVYSLEPGGITSASGSFTAGVISTTYTMYVTGTSTLNTLVTYSQAVTVTVTPAPTVYISVAQAQCGSTLAVASITTGGSAGNPSTISWSPAPHSINNPSTTVLYQLPSGPSPVQVSVAVTDQLGCTATATANVLPAPVPPAFHILGYEGHVLTCVHPSLSFTASSTYTAGPLAFYWASNSFTSASHAVNLSIPGNYSVTVADPLSQCATTKTFAITSNTVPPVSALSPTFQVMTCTTSASQVTLSANSPTINVEHRVISPFGGVFTSTSHTTQYLPGSPGTYTYQLVNTANGCITTKQFSVSSTNGFPGLTLVSTQNFSIGCAPKNFSDLHITNAATSPPGGTVTYSLLTPGSSTTLPTGTLGISASYTIITPGTYTVVVRDNATQCDARIPVTVAINTLAPQIDSISKSAQVLSCYTPNIILTAYTSASYNMVWQYIQTGTLIISPGHSVSVNASTLSVPSSSFNTYTLNVIDSNNGCSTPTVLTIPQNLYPPVSGVSLISSAISCITQSILATNSSQSTIPPGTFPSSQPVIATQWYGPGAPLSNSTTYTVTTPGVHSITVRDLNNGCTSTGTFLVNDDRLYDIVTTHSLYSLCNTPSVVITPTVTGSSGSTIQWYNSLGQNVGSGSTFTATTGGIYIVQVTNQYGCSSIQKVMVTVCTGLVKKQASEIRCWPNPAHDVVRFIYDGVGDRHVSIYSSALQIVKQFKARSGEQVSVSDLPPGIYTMVSGDWQTRFVKE